MEKKRNPSMQQIADALGVSRTTVSLCLAGKDAKYKINPDTRRKILEYTHKVGFVSNKLAQTVASGLNEDIGLLYDFSRKDDSRVDGLFYLVEHLTRLGRRFHIHHIDDDTFVDEVISLKGMGIADVIVVSRGTLTLEEVERLRPYMNNFRLFFNNLLHPPDIDCEKNIYITETGRAEAYREACEYLYSLGHRIVLADNNNFKYIQETGFFDDVVVLDFLRADMKRFYSNFAVGREYGAMVIEALKQTRATAVISHNYLCAQGIIQVLFEDHIKVPKDISVVCFGDVESNKYFSVPITAIKVPVFEMIDEIINHLGMDSIEKSRHIFYSTLIPRQSTARVQ